MLIDGGLIERIGPDLDAPDGTRRLDADGMIAVPGLINAHTHGHNNLARGMAGRWTLEVLISFGPAIQANRTPVDHYLSAALGAIEMLQTGATAAYDLYMAVPAADVEVLEPVVQAYEDVGLRVVLAPSIADGPFHRMMPGLLDVVPSHVAGRLERLSAMPARRCLDLSAGRASPLRRSGRRPGADGALADHPGMCSDELLRGLAELAREHGVGLHTHVSESRTQIVQASRRWGRRLVGQLASSGCSRGRSRRPTGCGWTARRSSSLARAGASVVHNPASNLRLGSGIAPVRRMLERGLNVALGSDGSISSDNQDMFEAMRLAGLVSRADTGLEPSAWIDAADAFERATLAGARALGCGEELGALEPGRRADVVLLRADSAFLRPRTDLLNALVFAETGASVDTVLVDGRIVLEHGRVVGVDEPAIRSRAQESVARLARENRELLQAAGELAPYVISHCRALSDSSSHSTLT